MSDQDHCSIGGLAPTDPAGANFDPGPGKHVLFFGDPMCSWCWGFAPELTTLQDALSGRAELHIVMGGLRPGTRAPWDASMRDYIRHHWQDVKARTGQPFDYARFDDPDFIYDTEPPCRALVAVRALAPQRALAMYESLQRAFYADGRDITDPEILADLAEIQDIERDAFLTAFADDRTRALVNFDFARTRAFGVSGFPSVICAHDGQFAVLALGFRPFAAFAPMLDQWLNA